MPLWPIPLKQQQRYCLGKTARLKSRKTISALFAGSQRIGSGPLMALYLVESGGIGLKAGFTPAKRNFKKATDRNRIKRLMREAYRLQKPALEQKLFQEGKSLSVFFIYSGKDLPEYKSLFGMFEKLLKRLEDICADEKP